MGVPISPLRLAFALRYVALVERMAGGPGSGWHKEQGHVPGSQKGADVTDVGITSARPGYVSAKVYKQMREFESNLK